MNNNVKKILMITLIIFIIIFMVYEHKYKNDIALEFETETTKIESEQTTENVTESTEIEPTYEETTTQIIEQSTQTSEIVIQASYISINFINQNPELPTGCEVTSLTMVLNYLGYNVDKCNLSDNYLDKGEIGFTDMNVAFIGNPRSTSSYGCYQDVIVNCANKYLSEQGSNYIASRATDNIYSYIDNGIPVIVWATMGMVEPYYTSVWWIDGREVKWLANEHCLVLIGYNASNNTVTIADPLRGIVEYDKSLFELRFEQMGSQAVVIK